LGTDSSIFLLLEGWEGHQRIRAPIIKTIIPLQRNQLLHELPSWRQSKKRKPIASSKYYFFDVGILAEEKRLKRYVCVSMEPRRRRIGDGIVLPYKEFLEELWGGGHA